MQTSRLLLAAGVLMVVSILRHSQAAEIPGIVATAGEGLQPSAGAESEDTVSCLAVIYPYSTWQPLQNSTVKQPSTSPPPSFIEGSIDFSLVNIGSNPIKAPWTLGIFNPLYTQVLQVEHLSSASFPHLIRENYLPMHGVHPNVMSKLSVIPLSTPIVGSTA